MDMLDTPHELRGLIMQLIMVTRELRRHGGRQAGRQVDRKAGRQSEMSCWWGCEVTKRAHQEIMRRNQPEHQTFAKALHTQAVSSLGGGGGAAPQELPACS